MARGDVGELGHKLGPCRPVEMGGGAGFEAFTDLVELLDLGDGIVAHLHALIGLADHQPDSLQFVKGATNGVPGCAGALDDLVLHQPLTGAELAGNDLALQVAIDCVPVFRLIRQRLGCSHPLLESRHVLTCILASFPQPHNHR